MDNSVKIMLIIMVSLIFIIGILSLAWVYSPTEFVIKFEVEDKTPGVINNFTEVLGNESNVENVMNEVFNKYSGELE